MKRLVPRLVAWVLPVLLSGCGGDDSSAPANVQGSYTVAVTDGADSCGVVPGWTQGSSSTNIPVEITQSGHDVTATVGGLAGTYLDTVLGAHAFTGTVSGGTLHLLLRGTRSANSGSCAYTITGTLTGTLDGDVLRGTIVYAPDTNQSPDCAAIAHCTAQQDFNGTRPPSR